MSVADLEHCPVCDGSELESIARLGPVPVNCSAFAETAEAARNAPRGSIHLACCTSCGFVTNVAFNAGLVSYDAGYDNALDASPTFRDYEAALVDALIARWDLAGSRILEVGCGNGAFLSLLCRRSGSTGIGFDPSWPGGETDPAVRIVPDFFEGEPAGDEPIDLLCCRHTLEHVERPLELMRAVRRAMGRRTGLYLEVPDAAHVLGSDDCWDLPYPHVGYYAAPSMRRLARESDMTVLGVESTFEDQFLSVHASAGPVEATAQLEDASALIAQASRFKARLARRVACSAEQLDVQWSAGRRLALWGAGARAVTWLNVVPGAKDIAVVIDANPHKWGRYVPGTGQKVVAPDDPVVRDVETVVVMNPVYQEEITARLCRSGSSADVVLA